MCKAIYSILDGLRPLILFVARLLLCFIFIKSGWGKINGFEQTAGFMAAKGMPAVKFFLLMAILFELGGGLSLLVGWCTRLSALALFCLLIPTTLIFHNFWAAPDAEKMMQTMNFMKNMAIAGGLLALSVSGGGKWSLDTLFNRSST